jgi:hypothetical protein
MQAFIAFAAQKFCNIKNNAYLCRCYLPMVAVMSSEEDGAAGWSTTLWKGVTDALFLDIRTSTID